MNLLARLIIFIIGGMFTIIFIYLSKFDIFFKKTLLYIIPWSVATIFTFIFTSVANSDVPFYIFFSFMILSLIFYIIKFSKFIHKR